MINDQMNIYILLSRSNTVVSRAIYTLGKTDYTHASLAVDDNMEYLYSFCRRYPRLPVPAGFNREDLYNGFYALHPTIPCRLYRLTISKEKYTQLTQVLRELEKHQKQLKYDLLGLMVAKFNIKHTRHNYRYCSWFIAELLGELNVLSFQKDYSLISPIDFMDIPCLELIYEGEVGDLPRLIKEKNLLKEDEKNE